MNPETNKFEKLTLQARLDNIIKEEISTTLANFLVRPDGSPVPKHWSVFTHGELIVIKDYTFKVAYIGETSILFEPVGLVIEVGK